MSIKKKDKQATKIKEIILQLMSRIESNILYNEDTKLSSNINSLTNLLNNQKKIQQILK